MTEVPGRRSCPRVGLADLTDPGQIDLDEDRPTLVQGAADRLGGGTGELEAPVDLGPLQHAAPRDRVAELLRGDEVIVATVDLAGAGIAGGHGDAEVEIGQALAQAGDDG